MSDPFAAAYAQTSAAPSPHADAFASAYAQTKATTPAPALINPYQNSPGPDQDVGTPKSWLRTLERNKYNVWGPYKALPSSTVDGLNDNFTQQLVPMFQKLQAAGYNPVITDGYAPSGHVSNSYHYTGQALDLKLKDANGNFLDPSKVQGLSQTVGALADQHGIKMQDEYANPSYAATGGHFHLQMMGPRSKQDDPQNQTVGKMRDTATGVANVYNIDPTIFKNQIQAESNWDPKAVSPVGARGLGQFMPETLQGMAKKMGFDPSLYDNNPSLQLRVSAEYMKDNLDHYKNYPQAIAAYNMGGGALANAIAGHQSIPAETQNYVAHILNITPDAARQAILTGNYLPYDETATKQVNAQQAAAHVDTAAQTLRNTFPLLNSQMGAGIVQAATGDLSSGQQIKPFAMFGQSGGTINDDPWAIDHYKNIMNIASMGLTSLFSSTRQTGAYEQYLSNYHTSLMDIFSPSKWNEGTVMNSLQGVADLAVSSLYAELLLPAVGAKMLGPAWDTFSQTGLGKTVASGASGIEDWLKGSKVLDAAGQPVLDALGNVTRDASTGQLGQSSKLTQGIMRYMSQEATPGGPTMFGSSLRWGGVMGASAFNSEFGDQLAAGKSWEDAFPQAMVAGTQGAVNGIISSIVIPMGLTAAGAFGTGIAGMAGGVSQKIWQAVQSHAPQIAEAFENGWQATPQSVKDILAAPFKGVLDAMSSYEKHGFAQTVQEALNKGLQQGENAYTYAQSGRIIKTVSESADRFAMAHAAASHELNTALQDFAQADAQVKTLGPQFQKQQSLPEIKQWQALQAEEARIQSEIGNMQAAKAPLKPGDPNRQKLEESIQYLKNGVNATPGGTPPTGAVADQGTLPYAQQALAKFEGTNPTVANYKMLQQNLEQAQQALAQAQANPAYVNKDVLQQQIQNMGLIVQNYGLYKQQVQGWAKARLQAPELSRATVLDPILANPGTAATQDSLDQLRLFSDSIRARIEDSNQNRVPLSDQELWNTAAMSLAATMPDHTLGIKAMSSIVAGMEGHVAALGTNSSTRALAQQLTPKFAALKGLVNAMEIGAEKGATPQAIAARAGIVSTWKELFDANVPVLTLMGKDPSSLQLSDPITAAFTKDQLWQASQVMMSEGTTLLPAAQQARLMDEAVTYLKGVGENVGERYDPSNDKTAAFLREFIHQHEGFKDAVDSYTESAKNRLRTPDEVHGATQDVISNTIGLAKSGEDAAKRVQDSLEAGFKQAFPKGIPADVNNKALAAMESKDPNAYRALFKDHPELYEPMKTFMAFQAYLEKYKLISPDTEAFFKENYMMHRYPRILEYLKGTKPGADVGAGSLASARKLSSEWEQKIPSLAEADSLAENANKTLVSAGLDEKTGWRKFANLGSDQARANYLLGKGIDMGTQDPVQFASKVMHDSLLANGFRDIPSIARFQTAALFRADGVRHMTSQFRNMLDEHGNPLLINNAPLKTADGVTIAGPNATDVGGRQAYQGSVRRNTLGKITNEPYQDLNTVPGMANVKIYYDGVPTNSAQWKLHPQAAEYLKNYAAFTKDDVGLLGRIGETIRSADLMTGGAAHLLSIQSNMFQLANFNMAAAAGLTSFGKEAMASMPNMVNDFLRHGGDSATLMSNIKQISQSLLSSTEEGQMAAKQLFGQSPEAQEGISKYLNALDKGIVQPVEKFVGAAHYFNQKTIFDAIASAQIGAWQFRTQQLFKKLGPDMMMAYGGDINAVMAQCKKLAAQDANTAAGVTSMHFVNDTVRNNYYKFLLSPQYTLTRARLLMSTLNGAITSLGGRDMFSHIVDPTLRAAAQNHMATVLAGGVVGGALFGDLMSIAINGRDTSSNPSDKAYHILLSSDPDQGETYMMNPFFGMFKPFFKTMQQVKAIHADSGEWSVKPVLDTLANLLNPALTAGYQTLQGQNAEGQQMPTDLSAPSASRFMQNLSYQFNIPALTGTTNIPEPGTHLSAAERIFSLLGVNTVRRMTGLRDASAIDARLRPYETALNENVDNLLDLSRQNGGYDTKVGQDYLSQAADMAYKTGVPMGDPKFAGLFKEAGLGNGDGNYVYTNEQSFKSRVLKYFAPVASGYAQTGNMYKGMLSNEIDQRNAAAPGRKGSVRGILGG